MRVLALATALVTVLVAPHTARGADAPAFTRKLRFEVRAPQAKQVLLVGPAAGKPEGVAMRRGDDWRWWAVLDLAPGRWAYAFQVDGRTLLDPTADGEEPDSRGVARSYVVVRPDDVNARLDPAVPHGTIERHTVRSAVLGQEMPYLVYRSPGLDPARRHPVIYLLHGANMNETQWKAGGVQNYLDNLMAQKRLPPLVAIMPAAPPVSFYRGDAERYLVEELAPEVARTLPVDQEPGRAVVAGLSMGGFGAVYLAYRHPGLFGRADALSAAAFDPSFLLELDRDLSAGKRFQPELAVRCGRQDGFFEFDRALVDILRRHGVEVTKDFGRGGHDWEYWRGAMEPMLEAAARFWAKAPARDVDVAVRASVNGNGNDRSVSCPNIAGNWASTGVTDASLCGGERAVTTTYPTTVITQDGCTVTLANPDVGTYTATLVGTTLTWSGSNPANGGTIRWQDTSTDVSSTRFTSTSTWTWDDGQRTCSGTGRTTFTKK